MFEIETRSFSFIIEESVLRRLFADDEACERQLRRLLDLAEHRNVALQAMPADRRGLHPGLRGSFVLLETPEHEHLAYEEGQTTGVLYADPEKVSIVMRRHEVIAREALSPGDTVRFITQLQEER